MVVGPIQTDSRTRDNHAQKQRKPRFSRAFHKAGDEARTRDLRLGKPTLYQLSYTRQRTRKLAEHAHA